MDKKSAPGQLKKLDLSKFKGKRSPGIEKRIQETFDKVTKIKDPVARTEASVGELIADARAIVDALEAKTMTFDEARAAIDDMDDNKSHWSVMAAQGTAS